MQYLDETDYPFITKLIPQVRFTPYLSKELTAVEVAKVRLNVYLKYKEELTHKRPNTTAAGVQF